MICMNINIECYDILMERRRKKTSEREKNHLTQIITRYQVGLAKYILSSESLNFKVCTLQQSLLSSWNVGRNAK